MPDDINEVAEQTTAEDTGFDTFYDQKAAEETTDDKKTEVSDETKPDEKVEDDKKPDEKPEEGDKKKAEEGEAKPKEGEEKPKEGEAKSEEDEEITAARQRIEDAAKERGFTDDDEETSGDRLPPPGADTEEGEGAAPSHITKEKFLDVVNYLSDDILPDGEFTIGDETMDFGKLKTDDPEIWNSMKFVAVTAAHKMAQDIVDNAGFVHVDDVKDMRKEINSLRFMFEVAAVHEDFMRLNKDPDFLAWKDEQPKSIQRLMSNAKAPEAIDVLTMYKKDRDAKAAAAIAGKQRDKKNKKDDLHKDTLRSKQDEEKKGEKGTGSDEDAGFHSYYDK